MLMCSIATLMNTLFVLDQLETPRKIFKFCSPLFASLAFFANRYFASVVIPKFEPHTTFLSFSSFSHSLEHPFPHMDNGEAIGMMAGAYFVSRVELLRWINQLTALNYTKIEQTANGVFACHAFDALFPGEVRLEKVKFDAKHQYEFVHNYKVLQGAFTRLKLKKQIDVEKLIKGKYQDNLEFMQWVKAFFEAHASQDARDYDGRARREAILAKTKGGPRTVLGASNRPRALERPTGVNAAPHVSKVRSAGDRLQRPAGPTVRKIEHDRVVEENARLEEDIAKLEQVAAENLAEREFYFNKLRNVEVIIQDLEDSFEGKDVDSNFVQAVQQIKEVLYAEDDVAAEVHGEQPYGEEDLLEENDFLPQEDVVSSDRC